MNLSEQFGLSSGSEVFPLTPHLEYIIQALLQTTERNDGAEANLRTAAYEALSSLVINCSDVPFLSFLQVATEKKKERKEKKRKEKNKK